MEVFLGGHGVRRGLCDIVRLDTPGRRAGIRFRPSRESAAAYGSVLALAEDFAGIVVLQEGRRLRIIRVAEAARKHDWRITVVKTLAWLKSRAKSRNEIVYSSRFVRAICTKFTLQVMRVTLFYSKNENTALEQH